MNYLVDITDRDNYRLSIVNWDKTLTVLTQDKNLDTGAVVLTKEDALRVGNLLVEWASQ